MTVATCAASQQVGLGLALPVSETMCLPGESLSVSELLHVLDVLRRRVARRTRGCDGAFAGFDRLEVSAWQDWAREGPISFTARLVSDDRATQVVEYTAVRCKRGPHGCQAEDAAAPLVAAKGTTVGLARGSGDRKAGIRFAIAPANR